MTFDIGFKEMSNPDKFPFGTGGFNTERPVTLTYRKYYNQRILNVDERFCELDYSFVTEYIVATKIFDDMHNDIWQQKPYESGITASQAKDPKFLAEYVRKDKHIVYEKCQKGHLLIISVHFELLSMIRQLGTPTWFCTVLAADLKRPDMIRVIARQFGTFYKTDEKIEHLSFEERCSWIKRNPVAAARHFHYRLNCLFTDFLKSDAWPLGEFQDFAIRIEFQLRGSPHAHCVLWVKDSRKFGIDEDSKVCDFIDQYVSCEMPSEEGLLKKLVSLVQTH